MKELFEKMNDEKINLEEYEDCPLTTIEKKTIKKRIKKKLNRRRSIPVKTLSAVASLALVSTIALNSNFALADIPIVGEKLEAFVHSQAGTLSDFKTIIGDSVEENGVKVTLNEVILDEGQLLISSTFHTKLENNDLVYNWFSDIDIYIDGQKIQQGGGGGPQEITESYINYFWTADIGHMDLQKEKSIRIVFNDLRRSDSEKTLKGKWSFKFKASGENLIANSTKIPINHRFTLENGQNIELEELILTPVSSKLVYKMSNIYDDVYFKLENEHGEAIQEILMAKQFNYDNYNRFVAIEGGKIRIIPIVSKEKHAQEVILTDEIIELDLDEK
ncbi:DUF4179 domain-containing protein [Cytobacillus praedii]|uniref:DUF4179 domain-containing protein n=1 Tax=Cytobacillus praedii TaxID=1742358 RepID=UPI00070CF6C2|nr:DUF4179 domain-containing protein [Cytobacillus praedii]